MRNNESIYETASRLSATSGCASSCRKVAAGVDFISLLFCFFILLFFLRRYAQRERSDSLIASSIPILLARFFRHVFRCDFLSFFGSFARSHIRSLFFSPFFAALYTRRVTGTLGCATHRARERRRRLQIALRLWLLLAQSGYSSNKLVSTLFLTVVLSSTLSFG